MLEMVAPDHGPTGLLGPLMLIRGCHPILMRPSSSRYQAMSVRFRWIAATWPKSRPSPILPPYLPWLLNPQLGAFKSRSATNSHDIAA